MDLPAHPLTMTVLIEGPEAAGSLFGMPVAAGLYVPETLFNDG